MRKRFLSFACCMTLCWACIEYSGRNLSGEAHALSADSSLAVVLATTRLLSDSCVPVCWPRDFPKIRPVRQYVAYISQDAYNERIVTTNNRVKNYKISHDIPSSYRELLDLLAESGIQKFSVNNVRLYSGELVKIGLINGLKDKLSTNDLGYLQMSPVIVNTGGDKAVFRYTLTGEFNATWLVFAQKKGMKWIILKRDMLFID